MTVLAHASMRAHQLGPITRNVFKTNICRGYTPSRYEVGVVYSDYE